MIPHLFLINATVSNAFTKKYWVCWWGFQSFLVLLLLLSFYWHIIQKFYILHEDRKKNIHLVTKKIRKPKAIGLLMKLKILCYMIFTFVHVWVCKQSQDQISNGIGQTGYKLAHDSQGKWERNKKAESSTK